MCSRRNCEKQTPVYTGKKFTAENTQNPPGIPLESTQKSSRYPCRTPGGFLSGFPGDPGGILSVFCRECGWIPDGIGGSEGGYRGEIRSSDGGFRGEIGGSEGGYRGDFCSRSLPKWHARPLTSFRRA